MRRLTALLLALLLALGIAALAEEERFVFRDSAIWGMSPEGAEESEDDSGNWSWDEAGLMATLTFEGVSVAGLDDVPLYYSFIGGKLVRAGYSFTGKDIDFDTLALALTQVYGEPLPADEDRLARIDCALFGQDFSWVDFRLANWQAQEHTYIHLMAWEWPEELEMPGQNLTLEYVDEPAALASALLPPDGVWGLSQDEALPMMYIDAWTAEDMGDLRFLRYDTGEYSSSAFPTLVFKDGALALLMREFEGDIYNINVEALSARLTERYGEAYEDEDTGRLISDITAIMGEGSVDIDSEYAGDGVIYWFAEDGTCAALTDLFDRDNLYLVVYNKSAIPQPTPEPPNTDGL